MMIVHPAWRVTGISARQLVVQECNTKGLKKRMHRLSRNQDRRPRADMKRTSFDHSAHRTAQGTSIHSTNQDSVTLPIARSLSNRGHSPTKAEVKKMNQCLVNENHRLKKDFRKTHHRLKTLLADKKDLLRQLLNQRRLTIGAALEISLRKNIFKHFFFSVQTCRYGVPYEISSRQISKKGIFLHSMCVFLCFFLVLLEKMRFWM